MESKVAFSFWIELAASIACVVLGVLTLISRDWIEVISGFDPDRGSGAAEWLIVTVLFTVAVGCSARARVEWRRAHPKTA